MRAQRRCSELAARGLGALAASLLGGCAAIYGPCTIDRELGRAWCEPGGTMILVPGSATLDVRVDHSKETNP